MKCFLKIKIFKILRYFIKKNKSSLFKKANTKSEQLKEVIFGEKFVKLKQIKDLYYGYTQDDKYYGYIKKKHLDNIQLKQNYIVDSKLIIINKLNKLSKIGTFLKTKSGFRVTNPEGFVAIDRMEGGAVKLVDRMEFSTNNFSKDIIKGWDNPG